MTVEHLSALDESFLRIETGSAPLALGWTMLLAGAPPSRRQLCAHVAGRLERLPRLRSRVERSSLRLHDPMWVSDDRFRIGEHVRTARIPRGGGLPGLRPLAAQLLSEPLQHDRPRWRLHLVDGLDRDRFALVAVVHPAVFAGAPPSALEPLLLDAGPLAAAEVGAPLRPLRTPGVLERARASAAERFGLAGAAGALAVRAVIDPSLAAEAAGELRRLGSALGAVGAPAPATALNRPIGGDRSLAFGRLSRHVARELARLAGATEDDVVLATASLALGRYLRRHGESHPWLRALVPSRSGERPSAVLVELPVGERNPRAALVEVARQARENRRTDYASALSSALALSRLAPAPLRGAAAWVATRPQTFNVVLALQSGPAAGRYMLGRRVLAIYPAAPLVRGHGVSVAVQSYCGSLDVGLCADPGVVPDVVDLAHDLSSAFDALRLALEPHRRPPVGGRRRQGRAAAPVRVLG